MLTIIFLLISLQSPGILSFVQQFNRAYNIKLFSKPINEETIDIPLGDGYKTLACKFKPIFASSKFIVFEYPVPFSINIDKPPKNFPAPIVSKSGPGGELPGDLLRATTCWSQGFSAAGATSDIAMFAGNVKWRKSVFDVTGAPWDQIVQALISNTSERSKTVTMVFEREIDDSETSSV